MSVGGVCLFSHERALLCLYGEGVPLLLLALYLLVFYKQAGKGLLMERVMQNDETEKMPVLKVIEWHPYNEELRRKALLATLNAVVHEPGTVGLCAFDWIEDLQESIKHPMRAEQAVALYRACLQVGIEPDYQTWCETEPGLFEEPEVAAERLRLQHEIDEDAKRQ